jgi:type II secretion system protein N
MSMSPLMKKLFKWIGYPLFALVMFVFFAYATCPYDKIKDRIEQHMSASGELEVSIDDLGPSPLTGLSADGVLVVMKPKPTPVPMMAPGSEGAPRPPKPKPLRLLLEEVVIKVGLIALMQGGTDVDFRVSGLGGRVEGSYTAQKKAGWTLKIDASDIQLAALPGIKEMVGLPLAGTLSAKVDLKVPKHRLSNASGQIEIECEACAIGDGKAKLKVPGNPMLAMGIKMPRVRLGRLGGRVQVENGEATLDNVSAKSQDVELKLEGGFSLRNPVAFSNAQAYLQFKVSPTLKKRDPKFELLESGLTNAKRSDGFFGMRVVGPLKSLRFIPSRVGPPQEPRRGPGQRGPRGGPRGSRRNPAHGQLDTPRKTPGA